MSFPYFFAPGEEFGRVSPEIESGVVFVSLSVLARAKINLTLDVLGKRPDGYHEVEMIMQSVELADVLEFYPAPSGLSLEVAGTGAPQNEENLVLRAARLLQNRFGVQKGVDIRLKKHIPAEAGLGGGSADAAAALRALNELWGLGLSVGELAALGAEIGSDVPFCVFGGTALACGRGEIIQKLPVCLPMHLVLVKPSFGVSTAAVYGALSRIPVNKRPDTRGMIEALGRGDIDGVAQKLSNVLEEVTAAMYPVVREIKSALLEAGALGAAMTGSGPTVFGIFRDERAAADAAGRLCRLPAEVFITKTCCN